MKHEKNAFVYNLVLTLTGVDINELQEDQAQLLAKESLELFMDYITYYIQEHYSLKDAIRVRTAYETGSDILETFPELVPIYEEAYQAFLQWLEQTLLNVQS